MARMCVTNGQIILHCYGNWKYAAVSTIFGHSFLSKFLKSAASLKAKLKAYFLLSPPSS